MCFHPTHPSGWTSGRNQVTPPPSVLPQSVNCHGMLTGGTVMEGGSPISEGWENCWELGVFTLEVHWIGLSGAWISGSRLIFQNLRSWMIDRDPPNYVGNQSTHVRLFLQTQEGCKRPKWSQHAREPWPVMKFPDPDQLTDLAPFEWEG